MIVVIGRLQLQCLIPHGGLKAEPGLPVEFDEGGFATGIDQLESVNAEPFHRPERAGDGAIGHRPHQHMGGLGHQ